MRERKERLGFGQQKAMWALGFVRHIVVALSTSRKNLKGPWSNLDPG